MIVLIRQNLITTNKDLRTNHHETGLPPQDKTPILETAADRETGMIALLKIWTAAEITGIAAVFLTIPRTTVENPARTRLTQRLKD